jgi:hypothetical protein
MELVSRKAGEGGRGCRHMTGAGLSLFSAFCNRAGKYYANSESLPFDQNYAANFAHAVFTIFIVIYLWKPAEPAVLENRSFWVNHPYVFEFIDVTEQVPTRH